VDNKKIRNKIKGLNIIFDTVKYGIFSIPPVDYLCIKKDRDLSTAYTHHPVRVLNRLTKSSSTLFSVSLNAAILRHACSTVV